MIFFIVDSHSINQDESEEKESKKIFVRYDEWESENEDVESTQSEDASSKQSDDVNDYPTEREEKDRKPEEKPDKAEETEAADLAKGDSEKTESGSKEENSSEEKNFQQNETTESETDSNVNQEQSTEQIPQQPSEEEQPSEEKVPEEERPSKEEESNQPSKEEQEEGDENAERMEQATQNGLPVIIVSNEKAKPGDTVTVNAVLVNNPGVLGTSMTLSYDESVMTLVGAKSGDVFDQILTMSHSKKLESGCVFLWDGENLKEEDIQDGVILTLEFKISESASAGKAPILLVGADGGTVDKDLQSVELVSETGFITIAE